MIRFLGSKKKDAMSKPRASGDDPAALGAVAGGLA